MTVPPAGAVRGTGRPLGSKISGSVSIQLSRNAARRPSTAGPRTRKCVSRHSCSFRASPFHSSAMPTPPVNPIASSTTITLRWVRWFAFVSCQPVQRTEPPDANAGVLHHVDQLALDRMRAPRVQEDPNPDARPRALGERLGERRPDLATPVDERQEVDRVLSLGDGSEHRREDLVAVAEDLDEVALRRGTPRIPSSDRRIRSARSDRRGVRLGSHRAPCSRRGADRAPVATERRTATRDGGGSVNLGRTPRRGTPARTASSCAAIATP